MEGGTIVLFSLVLALGQPGLSLVNLSQGRSTRSSDFRDGWGPSSLVVDDNDSDRLYREDSNGNRIPQCLYTIPGQQTTFWQVDLGQTVVLDHVVVIFRKGGRGQLIHQIRRNGYSIIVTTTSTYLPVTPDVTCYSDTDPGLSAANHENRSCSNIGSYVTLYNQRNTYSGSTYSTDAVLELCEVKVMGCPVYKHGVNCVEDCPANCVGSLCFPGNGTCMRGCQPGYIGTTCDTPCPSYYYGQDCTTECFCKEGPCNIVNGACPSGGCQPGYTGLTCSTECVDGSFGDNCGNICGHCISGSSTCDHRDGSCRGGCESGYKVHTCIEECDQGTYGTNCGDTCGSCLNRVACHHVNGTCLTGCDPGKEGDKCNQDCIPGTYGQNCANRCGNCKNGQTTCSITDGSCTNGCSAGWQGPLCKTACEFGRYGLNCAEQCGRCRNGPTCNRFNGTCANGCSLGWKEPFCEQVCLSGWYGDACGEQCGNCAGGYSCHHVHGRCPKDGQTDPCDPGWKGEKCKTEINHGFVCSEGNTSICEEKHACRPHEGKHLCLCIDGYYWDPLRQICQQESSLAARFVNTPMTFAEATVTCKQDAGYLADDVHFARVLKDCVTTNFAIFLCGVHSVDTDGTCITAQLVNGDIQQNNRANCSFKHPFVCINTAPVLTGGLCTSLEKSDTISTDAVSTGQLIGIISGVTVLLICVVAVGSVVCVRKRRQRQNPAHDSMDLQSQRPTETVSARNDVGAIASPGQNNDGPVVHDKGDSGDSPYDDLDNYKMLTGADAADNPYRSLATEVDIVSFPDVGKEYETLQAVGSNENQYSSVDAKG